MSYIALKHLHSLIAFVSLILLLTRGILWWRCPQRQSALWEKIVPHISDTFLLLLGIILLYKVHWAWMQMPWMHLKLTLIVVYIILGLIAMRPYFNIKLRQYALVSAVLMMGMIIAVAYFKPSF